MSTRFPFFMTLEDKQRLFLTDPLADLADLLRQARELNASRLLLLAGKHPVCRVNKALSPPLIKERLHFSQTESLAKVLLNDFLAKELDSEGSIETTVTIETETYPCTVFFGNGSHNFIIFLAEEGK